MDIEETYIAAAQEMLQNGPAEEDISSRLFKSTTLPASEKLPSWVPDWQISQWEIRIRGAKPFDATGMGRYCDRELFISFPTPRQLRLKGVLAGAVALVEGEKRRCGEAFESTLN